MSSSSSLLDLVPESRDGYVYGSGKSGKNLGKDRAGGTYTNGSLHQLRGEQNTGVVAKKGGSNGVEPDHERSKLFIHADRSMSPEAYFSDKGMSQSVASSPSEATIRSEENSRVSKRSKNEKRSKREKSERKRGRRHEKRREANAMSGLSKSQTLPLPTRNGNMSMDDLDHNDIVSSDIRQLDRERHGLNKSKSHRNRGHQEKNENQRMGDEGGVGEGELKNVDYGADESSLGDPGSKEHVQNMLDFYAQQTNETASQDGAGEQEHLRDALQEMWVLRHDERNFFEDEMDCMIHEFTKLARKNVELRQQVDRLRAKAGKIGKPSQMKSNGAPPSLTLDLSAEDSLGVQESRSAASSYRGRFMLRIRVDASAMAKKPLKRDSVETDSSSRKGSNHSNESGEKSEDAWDELATEVWLVCQDSLAVVYEDDHESFVEKCMPLDERVTLERFEESKSIILEHVPLGISWEITCVQSKGHHGSLDELFVALQGSLARKQAHLIEGVEDDSAMPSRNRARSSSSSSSGSTADDDDAALQRVVQVLAQIGIFERERFNLDLGALKFRSKVEKGQADVDSLDRLEKKVSKLIRSAKALADLALTNAVQEQHSRGQRQAAANATATILERRHEVQERLLQAYHSETEAAPQIDPEKHRIQEENQELHDQIQLLQIQVEAEQREKEQNKLYAASMMKTFQEEYKQEIDSLLKREQTE